MNLCEYIDEFQNLVFELSIYGDIGNGAVLGGFCCTMLNLGNTETAKRQECSSENQIRSIRTAIETLSLCTEAREESSKGHKHSLKVTVNSQFPR